MSQTVQMVRMTPSAIGAYTGPVGQLVVNTTTYGIHVQDNTTPGGFATLVANNNLSDLYDKAQARSNLNLVPGTDIQAYSAILTSLAASGGTANTAPYFSSANTIALSAITAFGLASWNYANAAAGRTALGLGTAAVQNTGFFDLAGAAATAQAAAIATAAADATTKANTAQANAISTAAADATSKANTAQANAISTASADATSKANAAQAAAISTASSDATTKANAAQAAAIAAAATDATTKSNAAQAAAISAAATDATTKANAAQAAAISSAATDATTKANAAQAAAIASAISTGLQKASNLSDVANAGTSRVNLGVKSMATRDVTIQSGGSPSGGADGDIFLIY